VTTGHGAGDDRSEVAVATVLVCDDSPLAREAMRRLLASVPGVTRVLLAGSGEEVLGRYETDRPDLVLMDVRMPGVGGVEATRRLLAVHPDAVVVMVIRWDDGDSVTRAIAAGARGFLHRDAGRAEVGTVVSAALADAARRAARVGLTRDPPSPALTERELQVLAGMSRGRTNSEIGRELYLSEDTVKTHARRLFRKLGAADRAQAVAMGFRSGLVR
jgi:DNA-binding NarL/FixJ family response regulator